VVGDWDSHGVGDWVGDGVWLGAKVSETSRHLI